MGEGERGAGCPSCGRRLDAYVSREGRHAAQLDRWSARLPASRTWRQPSAPARLLVHG